MVGTFLEVFRYENANQSFKHSWWKIRSRQRGEPNSCRLKNPIIPVIFGITRITYLVWFLELLYIFSLFLQNKILLSLILFKESGRKVDALRKRVATRQFKNQDPGFADSFLTTVNDTTICAVLQEVLFSFSCQWN